MSYASVHVVMLDRDSGTSKKAAIYPVTEVTLVSLDGRLHRFTVNADGNWITEPPK